MSTPFDLVIVSSRDDLAAETARSLAPLPTRRLPDCANAVSIGHLFNRAIRTSPCETVILVCDKARPNIGHVQKILDLLDRGFGLVGLHDLRFFGARKDLFRGIGLFDETFVGGSYSGHDLICRMMEANVALYFSKEVEFLVKPSLWSIDDELAMRLKFCARWGFELFWAAWRLQESEVERLPRSPGWDRPNWLPWSASEVAFEEPERYGPCKLFFAGSVGRRE